MADRNLVEPDVNFVKEIAGLGGDSLKKCFQCATCSVVCPVSPDNKPFPRKEMIAASWGLKDRLVKNHDLWLCHNCGDCSAMCPRGAKPGDVVAAVRAYTVSEYATPKWIGRAINDPKQLPLLMAIPVIIFIVLGLATGLLDFTPAGDEVIHARFFSTWLVDMIFVPLAAWAVIIFGIGIKRFVNDIHENAVLEGKTDRKELDITSFVGAFFRSLPTILKHTRFSECSENKERATAHILVFFSFIALFIVTGIIFFLLYGLQIPGPHSQLSPIKWLANAGGVALIVGSILMIRSRLSKPDQVTSYKDWYLLALVLGLGVTGMLTQATRLAGLAAPTYFLYFIHLVFVFHLFAFLPFSKLAHIAYRTVAVSYDRYANRQ